MKKLVALTFALMLLDARAAAATGRSSNVERLAQAGANSPFHPARFAIEDLQLDVADVAAAALLGSNAGATDLPASDSPLGAVLRLAHAYAFGRVAEYGALMTEDFRFEFGEIALRERHPNGFGREDEMASLDHLAHGFTDAAGVHRPAMRSARLRFTELRVEPDSEHPEDPDRRAIVRARAELHVTLVTGEVLGLFEGLQEFRMARGDAAALPAGSRADADHWYVQRWIESAVEAINAESDGQSLASRGGNESAVAVASSGPGSATDFAITVTPSPTSGPLLARIGLSESGDARIDLLDISGRRVSQLELPGRGPGRFTVSLAGRSELASGVYWVRLIQGPRLAIVRAVVVR